MGKNKHLGSNFKDYLRAQLAEKTGEAAFLHLKNAFEDPDITTGDNKYLWNAINDLVEMRGKSAVADRVGISRQGLHNILELKSDPTLKSFQGILRALGARLTVERI